MASPLPELVPASSKDTTGANSPPVVTAGKLLRLEAVRGLAAVYVFLGHVIPDFLLPRSHPLSLPFRFGQEAVMVFFLLSGFVIEHSFAQNPQQGFRHYFLRRFTRIYPIFLLALGLAYILPSGDPATSSRGVLGGNVLMLQDLEWAKPGVWFTTFAGNLPLWSLSYEWWFYLGFFVVRTFVAPPRQIVAVAAIAAIGAGGLVLSPSQFFYFATYFPAWWLGVELSRGRASGWKLRGPLAINVAILLGLSALFLAVTPFGSRSDLFKFYPGLVARHLFVAVTIVGVALIWRRERWRGFGRWIGPFARFSGISYGLYVLHFPLVTYWRPLAGIVPVWFSVVMAATAAVVLAWLAEGPYQAAARRLIQTCVGERKASARG